MDARLIAEIRDDPLGRVYSGMTDAQVAASLNTADRQVQGPVPINQVLRWSAGVDGIHTLRQASETGPPAKRQLADAALQLVNHPHVRELDVTDPELSAMLDGLVVAGIFDQPSVDALVARGVQTLSRAAELGLGHVKNGHVQRARAALGA